MIEIREEDEYNDTYGRVRMRETLLLKKEQDGLDIEIPEERTIYRIMQKIGISHRPRKPMSWSFFVTMAIKIDCTVLL